MGGGTTWHNLFPKFMYTLFSVQKSGKPIDDEIRGQLYSYLGGICRGMECSPVQIGGYYNHIHVLCTLGRKIAQVQLMEELKKQSSKWIKTKGSKYSNFYWQGGYGIFSVNPKEVELVSDYIKKQDEHHETKSFQEEYLSFLKKYNVDYNEEYLWV